jgi:hypothetical protein
MNTWQLKLVRICSIVMSMSNVVLLIYRIGYASGFDAAQFALSDFDFYHWLNRLHFGITMGFIVSAVGLWIDKIRGLLVSAIGLLGVTTIYVWWYLKTQLYVINSEVTEYTRLHDPYYRRLIFHGANWWDMFVLALTLTILIWTILTVFRTIKSKSFV